jgi:hypothetical protein
MPEKLFQKYNFEPLILRCVAAGLLLRGPLELRDIPSSSRRRICLGLLQNFPHAGTNLPGEII